MRRAHNPRGPSTTEANMPCCERRTSSRASDSATTAKIVPPRGAHANYRTVGTRASRPHAPTDRSPWAEGARDGSGRGIAAHRIRFDNLPVGPYCNCRASERGQNSNRSNKSSHDVA